MALGLTDSGFMGLSSAFLKGARFRLRNSKATSQGTCMLRQVYERRLWA